MVMVSGRATVHLDYSTVYLLPPTITGERCIGQSGSSSGATRHAEMEAIDFLVERWQKHGVSPLEVSERFSKCILYVTCEPCIMCAAALSYLGIKEAYYGCANDKFGGCGSILSLHTTCSDLPSSGFASSKKGFKCTGGIMSSEAVSLFRSFYEQGNPNAPKPHRTLKQPLLEYRN